VPYHTQEELEAATRTTTRRTRTAPQAQAQSSASSKTATSNEIAVPTPATEQGQEARNELQQLATSRFRVEHTQPCLLLSEIVVGRIAQGGR